MSRSRDLLTYAGALALHVGIAYSFLHLPPRPKHTNQVVELLEAKRPPPPPPKQSPPEPVPPPPEPPPPRRVVTKHKVVTPPQTVTPKPNAEPPKEPPKEPPAPVFGVTMDSVTAGDSSFAVPVGNTTMIDPSKSAKHSGQVAPLPAAPGPPPERPYQPVSALYVKTMPDIDAEDCGRGVPYPDKARVKGIEGNVILRVSLDEKGHVHDVKVVTGLGYGLDEAAMRAIRSASKCKFSPAIANDGKPVAYVIPAYTFHFELPK